MSMGNLAMLLLDQLVDVGINVGSRYAQSILEILVYNLSSRLGLPRATFWRTAHISMSILYDFT
jgi:hypothetical protein